jgi:hypothetical protein
MLSKLLSGEQTERGDRNRGGKAQVAWTPHFNKRETRFAIVLILRDSDGVAEGAGFSGFGCTERVVMMAIISDVWEMRFAGKRLGLSRRRGSALGCGFRDLSS